MNFEDFTEKYGIRLNEQQERAVRKVNGPAMLLAVPGSGKTAVIVARVGFMTRCAGIRPENILTLTFSRAAASEMKRRFCDIFGTEAAETPHFSTIHSFCLSVIRKCEAARGLHVPKLIADNRSVIRKAYMGAYYEYPTDMAVNELARCVGYCKNMMITGIGLEGIRTGETDFRRFYEEYEGYKKKNDLMDFDDQLLFACEILEKYPEILDAVQDRYRYINIDEAQDTSLKQHEIIRKISSKHENLFMVGDEDQSIYSFRAACPDALLRFEKDHPGAEIMLLETNYRCSAGIVDAAERVIRTNRNRYAKDMRAVRGKGKVRETKLRDARYQYRYIADSLRKAAMQGREIAVLYRNNESAVPLMDLLEREGIAYDGDIGLSFFGNAIVRDILNIFRLILDPRDPEAYREVYHKLGLYTTKRQLAGVLERVKAGDPGTVFEILAQLETDRGKAERIAGFGRELAELGELLPFDALKAVCEMFYRKWIEHRAADGTDSVHGIEHKLNTMLALSVEYRTIGDFIIRAERLADRAAAGQSAASDRDGRKDDRKPVTLSTIHSSKGMEYDKVILIDVYNGILPSATDPGPEGAGRGGYEEEVRLFYVALTRARDEVEIVTAPRMFGRHLERSPFADMLFAGKRLFGRGGKTETGKAGRTVRDGPAHAGYTDGRYSSGTRLKHKYFGEGIIINRTGDMLSVRFKDGDKKMLLSACLKWGYIEPSD